MEIVRIIDNKQNKKIIAFTKESGRVVLFSDEDYPADGIIGLTKAKFDKALTDAMAKKEMATDPAE